jgi:Amt family ammonium transporter
MPGEAALIGLAGGILVVGSIVLLDKLRIDDPVGAISVHGTCGIWGLLAVCFTNSDATLSAQLMGISAIFLWTFVVGGIAWMVIKLVMGLRISEEEEIAGSDISEIGIEAYPEFTR